MTGIVPALAGNNGLVGGPGGTPLTPNALQGSGTDAQIVRVRIPQPNPYPTVAYEWSLTMPTAGSWNTGYGTIQCPNGVWGRVLCGLWTFSTVASGPNRFPGAQVLDPAAIVLARSASGNTFPAGLGQAGTPPAMIGVNKNSEGFKWAGGTADGYRIIQQSFPAALILQPGWTWGSWTTAWQTGDQYSAIELLMEIWLSAPTYDGLGPSMS